MEEPTLAAQNALDDTLSDYETQKLNQILTLNEGQRDALCAAFQNIRSRANCPNPPCPDPPGA